MNVTSYSSLAVKLGSHFNPNLTREPGETENAYQLRCALSANPYVLTQSAMDPDALARCITNSIILNCVYSIEVTNIISEVLTRIMKE